jgi:hypothetical protein
MYSIPSIYHGWDVHSYTKDLNMDHLTDEFEAFRASISYDDALSITKTIENFFLNHSKKAKIMGVMTKMLRRFNNISGKYEDRQMNGINIFLLLDKTAEMVGQCNDTSMNELFLEILEDCGNTCTQGDSHRIAGLYIALTQIDTFQ